MKKRRKVILFSIIAIGVSASLVYGISRMPLLFRIGDNLLKNSSFELVNWSGKLKFWLEDPKEGWSVDTDNPYEGENSMKAKVGWSWLSQDVRVRPDRYYIIKVYVKSDIALKGEEEKDNALLRLECLDEENQVIRTDYEIITATSLWQQYMRQMYAPQGTNKIRISIAKRQGEGSVWFDELEFEEIPAVSVLNSSFEILDEQGRPKYWLEDSRKGWSVSTEGAYQGENCMQATVGWSWLSQEIPVKPDKYYFLKAYLKSNIPASGEGGEGNAFLGLDYLDAKGQVIEGDYSIVNTTSFWQQEIQQIYVSPEIYKIRVKFAKRQGEGSVWFDELELEEFELEEVPAASVLNPSFEILDEQGRPKYWLEDSRKGWSISTEGAYQGDNCMQATVGWSWLSQEIWVEPDKYYFLKAYLKSNIPASGEEGEGNAFFGFDYMDAKGQVIEGDYSIVNTTSFWQQEIQQIYAPAGIYKIRVKLAKRQGEGSVWFDELELEEFKLEEIPAASVLNPSFEILDEQGRPKYWPEDSKKGWSVSTEGAYEGENCMQATVGWSWLSQEIWIKPDKYYLLKAYLKSNIPASGEEGEGNAFFGFDYMDAKGQVIEGDYSIVNTTSFWQQEIQQIYAPAGIYKIRVKLAKRQGEGSVWYDELELEEIPAVLVLNPSFEILDEQGRPKYWLEDSQKGWSVSTEEAYQGDNCMQATVGWSWLSQEIPVKPEKGYTLRVYSRSDIIIPREEGNWSTFLALECLNKEREIIENNMIQLNISYSWKPHIISIHASENTEKMRIKLAKRKGGGSVWFDNLEIVKLTWYMKSTFLHRIAEDKPFFIFYFAVYLALLISLIRIILKR